MDPAGVLGLVDRAKVRTMAAEVKERLQRVSRALAPASEAQPRFGRMLSFFSKATY
jgi:hypothetical protein